jgi:hypothetical protein
MRRATLSFILLAITFFATGCPRYETVRRVSDEQLKIQKSFRENLGVYLGHMLDFAKNQAAVNKDTLKGLESDKLAQVRIDANDDFGDIKNPTQEQRDANREKLGQAIAFWQATYASKRNELDDLVKKLAVKHQEILNAYDEIISTQEVLNKYIQLKKYDEVIVDGLMDKLKINQDKVNGLFKDAADVADTIGKPPAAIAAK